MVFTFRRPCLKFINSLVCTRVQESSLSVIILTYISMLCLELMASFSSSPVLLLNLDSGPSSSLSKYVPKINLCWCFGIFVGLLKCNTSFLLINSKICRKL